MSLWSRLANAFRGDRVNREVDEELESHIAEAIEQGREPAEARRAFGSVLRTREESRDVRLAVWLDSLRADTVFGWRQLMKKKATSAAAILSLALGIGACTSAFRLIDALLLRPLPVAHPERLYAIAFEGPSSTDGQRVTSDSCSYPMFVRMRDAVSGQAELLAVSLYNGGIDLTYGSDQDIEKVNLQYVSGSMFDTFGQRPAIGRLLSGKDDLRAGASPYAVLSYDYWKRRFGRDPGALGRTFRIGNDVFQIVGVAAEPFTGTEPGRITDVFVPITMKDSRTLAGLNRFWMRTLLQLRSEVPNEPVQERLRATFRVLQAERAQGFPTQSRRDRERFFEERLQLEPAAAGRSNLQGAYRQALAAFGVLVALVLLIACANVANLMTAQAAARAREMALRVSIGAGRWRLVQLMLVESAWIAFLAAAGGAVFTWRFAPLIVGMINPAAYPVRLVLPADWRVLGFGLALTSAVTLLFGLTPALRASAIKPAGALRGGEDPYSRRRLMHALIAAQVAFCVIVHFAAGLLVSSFARLTNQPTGFSAERILNLEAVTERPQVPAFWEQVAAHLRSVPGVERVAITGWPLLSGEHATGNISINGAPPTDVFSDFVIVSPGWIDEMKIPFMGGRDFQATDTNPKVAIVNQAFAKQYFAGENPIGKSFERVEPAGGRARLEVVGFVRDARSRDDMRLSIRPTAYVPFQSVDGKGAIQAMGRGTFVVRTSSADPLALAAVLRREVVRARPGFRVTSVSAQSELNQSATVRERLLAVLALFFAIVAQLLAGIGLYGVLDYGVLQRRREIGIRIAIGAQASDIARRVTADVFRMVLIGAAVGLASGVALVRYIEALLYGVRPTGLPMLALPAVMILAAGLVAAIPAVMRAVRIDPVSMLRAD